LSDEIVQLEAPLESHVLVSDVNIAVSLVVCYHSGTGVFDVATFIVDVRAKGHVTGAISTNAFEGEAKIELKDEADNTTTKL